ncbi:MAG: hypothetical protein ACRCZF_16110, partial [Gemmataceae bacterium]
MPIKVTCNHCGGTLHAPDDSLGKRGRCPTCATILTITADSPRVGPSSPGFTIDPEAPARGPLLNPNAASAKPAPTPGLESSVGSMSGAVGTYDLADNAGRAGAGAFGRPAAPQTVPAPATRFAPPPAARPDPFLKSGKQADSTGNWSKVRRGLAWVRTGVVFLALAIVLCPILEAVRHFGVQLPDKNPGFLQAAGLSSLNEIRVAVTMVPAGLGLFCLVIGRFSVGAVPGASTARGLAKCAGFATLLAFLGFVAYVAVTGQALMQGVLPKLQLDETIFRPELLTQDRVQKYSDQFFLSAADPKGQMQRMGLTLLLAGLVAGEFWFLAALGRIAAFGQSTSAAGRVNRYTMIGGLLLFLVPLGLVAADLFGIPWLRENVLQRFQELPPA